MLKYRYLYKLNNFSNQTCLLTTAKKFSKFDENIFDKKIFFHYNYFEESCVSFNLGSVDMLQRIPGRCIISNNQQQDHPHLLVITSLSPGSGYTWQPRPGPASLNSIYQNKCSNTQSYYCHYLNTDRTVAEHEIQYSRC